MDGRVLNFGSFSVVVADGWKEITATLDDAPLTLADEGAGVGALQFSPAIYRGGNPPRIGPEELVDLLDDFASKHGLREEFDRAVSSDCSGLAGASYCWDEDFIRVWYLSDGWSIILATYVCEWQSRGQETPHVEDIVRSIRFGTARPALTDTGSS